MKNWNHGGVTDGEDLRKYEKTLKEKLQRRSEVEKSYNDARAQIQTLNEEIKSLTKRLEALGSLISPLTMPKQWSAPSKGSTSNPGLISGNSTTQVATTVDEPPETLNPLVKSPTYPETPVSNERKLGVAVSTDLLP